LGTTGIISCSNFDIACGDSATSLGDTETLASRLAAGVWSDETTAWRSATRWFNMAISEAMLLIQDNVLSNGLRLEAQFGGDFLLPCKSFGQPRLLDFLVVEKAAAGSSSYQTFDRIQQS
jgi:hypothetical protein